MTFKLVYLKEMGGYQYKKWLQNSLFYAINNVMSKKMRILYNNCWAQKNMNQPISQYALYQRDGKLLNHEITPDEKALFWKSDAVTTVAESDLEYLADPQMKDYVRVNKLAYDILSEEYKKRSHRRSQYEENPETLGSAVLRHTRHRFDHLVTLEVGPGSGEMLYYFENHGCRTTAVELSTRIIKVAAARSPHTIMVAGNILNIEFVKEQFDIIYAGALIHLFPFSDAVALIRKFHTWLAPEGVLFVNTTVHPFSEEGYLAKKDYHPPVMRFRKRWTEKELHHSLEEVQFEILEKLTTYERNRQKYWVAFICRKNQPHNSAKRTEKE